MIKPPRLDAWYVESMIDGGVHYGYLSHGRGEVAAICGARFRPLFNPTTKKVVVYTQLKDARHACRMCLLMSPQT